MSQKQTDNALDRIASRLPQAIDLLATAPLTDELKGNYKDLIQARAKRLKL